jgi:hypothetical protein
LLSDFERSEIEYPLHYKDLHRVKCKEVPKPFPHQLEAISQVAEKFQNTERGQLIMASCTGKTAYSSQNSPKSTKIILEKLGGVAKKLADIYLHEQARPKEPKPTGHQVNYTHELDFLL